MRLVGKWDKDQHLGRIYIVEQSLPWQAQQSPRQIYIANGTGGICKQCSKGRNNHARIREREQWEHDHRDDHHRCQGGHQGMIARLNLPECGSISHEQPVLNPE